MRILELFAGIGAIAHAVDRQHEIAAAIDINENAKAVYQANFTHRYLTCEITSLTDDEFREFKADLWWMSPPCQPFTRRGNRKDIHDPRAQPMLRVFEAIDAVKPAFVALENVSGFEESNAWKMLESILSNSGYAFEIIELCSSMFGLPNARPRIFVVAAREKEIVLPALIKKPPRMLGEFLDPPQLMNRWQGQLDIDHEFAKAYFEGINLVANNAIETRCFTSAYGKSHVQSGSYLKVTQTQNREAHCRRLSPTEIVRLLGFSDDFCLPVHLSTRQLWKLVGNSVSIPCVRFVLRALSPDKVSEGPQHA